MKKLVAWKEEPVMETSAENEETVNRADMGRDEKPTFEEDIDKPIVKSERRPTKKDIDREEGRKGSERRRRESRYKEDSHRSSSSHRPTESNPSTHSSERRSTIRPYRTKRTSEWKEIMEHQDKMSKLEKSLHELYPTSKITVHENTEEEPISLYKKWSNGDIPVEKLLTDGVDQLSESELLAIIMGNGPKEFPTVDLMNYVLDDCANDLNRLAKKTVEELMCYRGIGKNRAISVVAACEFGKRFRKTAPEEKPILKDALAVGNYMIPQLEDLDVEEFWALFLNPKHEMLRRVRICRGEVSENATDPRNIMRFGVMYNASYIVTVHNHISGNPSPTKFDNMIAEKLTKAAEAVRMTLRDHIILADEQYFSFKDNKKL
jgi:DNA repair protein RadC